MLDFHGSPFRGPPRDWHITDGRAGAAANDPFTMDACAFAPEKEEGQIALAAAGLRRDKKEERHAMRWHGNGFPERKSSLASNSLNSPPSASGSMSD